jgi:hypothetical protein
MARVERRMHRAGQRYRAVDGERTSALAELKSAINEADGHFSAQRAAALTGLPMELLSAIQPDLRGAEETTQEIGPP